MMEIMKDFERQVEELKERIKKTENILLNIHYNSDLYIKIIKMEQDLTRIKTDIFVLQNINKKEE